MIITRAPFRVSFCGGGSDIPSFYEEHGGCVLSTSIRKYMYLSLHKSFDPEEIVLKYSETEIVRSYNEIKHRYFKEILSNMGIKGVEISSMADIPSGTGLGSSSAFTVALLHLLHTYKETGISKYQLAEQACNYEINKLANPIGKQDQYASAFGGLNFIEFKANGCVSVEPLILRQSAYEEFENNLMMFYLGGKHSASEILQEQKKNINKDEKVIAQLKMCDLARTMKKELESNNVHATGELLHENWMLKKTLAYGISNPVIDDIYKTALDAGAMGGKLLGAGGTGFMLFYVPDEKKKNVKQSLAKLREIRFKMENSGATIIYFERDNII